MLRQTASLRRAQLLLVALFALYGIVPGCAEGGGGEPDAIESMGEYAEVWAAVRPVIAAKCARCHSADRLSTYRRLETHGEVTALRASILDKFKDNPPRGLRMPLASNHVDAQGCVPDHAAINDKRLTDDEQTLLVGFLNRDDHQAFVDTSEPIVAPEIERLADAVTYTSSPFDVVNDGFITPPNGSRRAEYMEEYGYDQRDLDQMEDDWFCIEFDPMRTDMGYLTGVQVLTEIGQIYLNSQLVIDTTGASAAAKAAATEKGQDWYRCDGGLGFDGAVPLWRTVPGGGAVELPDQTGLRFEPGWKFILRADFHTHFDKEAFNALNQKGVIDDVAGTMTWFNQASLLVRWAAPSEVSRELKWMTVGPSTQAEKDAFVVPPGLSVSNHTAPMPADDTGAAKYAVFSAEVEMGKNGHWASLRESNSQACIANNSDFSPKWIEQAIYAEAAAPTLDPASVLDLECKYRNEGKQGVGWGLEGEASVWGRKERCQALVFYYPTNQ